MVVQSCGRLPVVLSWLIKHHFLVFLLIANTARDAFSWLMVREPRVTVQTSSDQVLRLIYVNQC